MLVVEKKHHSKLYVDSLDQTDRKKAVSFLEESFPEAEIYEEVSDDEYTDDFAVAEARAAYATMKPSSMLKALRQEQSMTQKQLAEAVGISTTAISAMENDSRQISLAMAERLAKVLVTNPKVFLDPALLETIIL